MGYSYSYEVGFKYKGLQVGASVDLGLPSGYTRIMEKNMGTTI